MYSMQRSMSIPGYGFHNYNNNNKIVNRLQKSQSLGNCIIEKKRGFKPSDRHDPVKKEFLVNLSKKIWHMDSPGQGPKCINLEKLFTPATDGDEILPKNRKLYASSAFYSPNLHPTVEDQVELARRISHSLSDISNQQSKGQSMYVNRKKRSVKWVHEGEGKCDLKHYNGYSEECKENEYTSSMRHDKMPLKLVMDPRGHIQDYASMRPSINVEGGLLSPDKCAELVNALNAPKGKGAELFAKRRKKSEKWIIDETNAATQSPSGVPYGQKPTTPTPILPAYSDVGIQRVQLNMHQDQVQDKYSQPRLKLVKTPWEAALETGSANTAFEEINNPYHQQQQQQQQKQQINYDYGTLPTGYNAPPPPPPSSSSASQTYQETIQQYELPSKSQLYPKHGYQSNNQRDLAYKPSVPQGWNAPPPELPKELYTPKEIPLDCYAPPPIKNLPISQSFGGYSTISTRSSAPTIYGQQQQSIDTTFPTYETSSLSTTSATNQSNFPISINKNFYETQQYKQPSSATYKSQQQSKISQLKNTSPTHYNPSPLPYQKIAKFEQTTNQSSSTTSSTDYYNNQQSQVIRNRSLGLPIINRVQNTSPTPFSSSSSSTSTKRHNFPIKTSSTSQTTITKESWYQTPQGKSEYKTVTTQQSSTPIGDNNDNNQYYNEEINYSHDGKPSQHQHCSDAGVKSSDCGLGNTRFGYGGGLGSSGIGNSHHYHQQHNSRLISSGGGGAGGMNLTQCPCQNYNTAPRGWNQMSDYYRPITFSQSRAELPYTDF